MLTSHAAGLSVSGSAGSLRISYQDAVQPSAVRSGLVWARLEVGTVSGYRILRGFPRADLERVAAAFNAGLTASSVEGVSANSARMTASSVERVSAIARACSQAREQVDALLSQPRYVRDSARAQVDSAVESAIALSRHTVWAKCATVAQKTAVAELRDYLARSVSLLADANRRFVAGELARFQPFFDAIESNPLTDAQRTACVVNDERNLVLAGAGTGKTSVMIGRAGYLIASGQAHPEQILMLAYGRKAMQEMQDRQDSRLGELLSDATPTIKTFHSLGLEIIGSAEGLRPDITPMAEDPRRFAHFVDEQVRLLSDDSEYRRKLIQYDRFDRFPYRSPFDFDSRTEYDEYVRTNELVTLKGEAVKSFEEVVVANFLATHGIEYQYERPYPFTTATATRRQYKPDFYLPAYDIYIEHFALDKRGLPPAHFGAQYGQGVIWKHAVHRQHETRLLETYSWLKKEGILESTLEAELLGAGVELVSRSDDELLQELRESTRYSHFADLIVGFIGLLKDSQRTIPELRREEAAGLDRARHLLLLDLIEPILEAYERDLAKHGQIDFADMITRATELIREGRFESPYTHVLVDEFQDISLARMRLLEALLQRTPGSTLFVVGDDWQSIFGFTGSDIALTRDFETRVGHAATTILDTTFRFNDQIGEVASRFVQRNPLQIKKSIKALVQVDEPAVSLLGTADAAAGLVSCLNAIAARAETRADRKTSVLVLSRYNFTHEDLSRSLQAKRLANDFPSLEVRFTSMHSAKGKEADFVVVVGLVSGSNGFPARKPVDGIMKPLLPPGEDFKFAEERRVFYVALTRARHRVYLIYDPDKPSRFVTELLEEEACYPITRDEFGPASGRAIPVSCPRCADGTLVLRTADGPSFVGCSNYPYCHYTAPTCDKCGGIVRVIEGVGTCSNHDCGAAAQVCPVCGGRLVVRKGPRGSRFLGCTNYASDNCTYTAQLPR